jgi:hypothetical protein
MISYRESQLKSLIDKINAPTKTYDDGTKVWRNKESVLHRGNDKPAIEYPDGSKEWYINGLLHRENDKPAVD